MADDLTSHDLRISRRPLGSRPQGGNSYGTVARCSCGWTDRVNEAPSKGGQREMIRRHAGHVEVVEGAEIQFRLGSIAAGVLDGPDDPARCSVEGCHQPAFWQLLVILQERLTLSLPVCRHEGPAIVRNPQEWIFSRTLEDPPTIRREVLPHA